MPSPPVAAAEPDLLAPALDLIAGYHATTPLTAGELDLLPDLILARIVARIVISEWRAERFPDNRGYVLRNTPRALRERRVLISATGPHGSTLKIRPPLPFARPHVDQLAEALTAALRALDRGA